jgi:hypothetical protein
MNACCHQRLRSAFATSCNREQKTLPPRFLVSLANFDRRAADQKSPFCGTFASSHKRAASRHDDLPCSGRTGRS